MADRTLRDELLESERWLSLKDNADRVAFIALILTADSFGDAEAGEIRLLRLWRDYGINTPQLVAKTLAELAECDLIRLYESGDKRYLHIPRFGQRERYVKRLHPLSPWATDEQKQLLAENSPGERPARDRRKPDARQVQDRGYPDSHRKKRSEEKLKDAAETPSAAIAIDPKKRLFDLGVTLLTAHGTSESSARSFLALQCKNGEGGEARLSELLGYLAANPKVEPRSYIAAAMKPLDPAAAMRRKLELMP